MFVIAFSSIQDFEYTHARYWEYFSNNQKVVTSGVLQKGVLKNVAKFAVKQLCQSLFLNKVAGLRSSA